MAKHYRVALHEKMPLRHRVRRSAERLNLKGWLQLMKATVTAWIDDDAPSMGASIAYYTLFSIAPLLFIVISIAGFVFGTEAAQGAIFGQLAGMLGPEGAKAIEGLLASAGKAQESLLSTVLGFVMLLIGATTVFGELQKSLDQIWRVPATRRSSGILNLLRTRLLSFGLIIGVGFLLLVSLILSTLLSAFGAWWAPLFAGWELLAQVLNFIVSFLLITVLFAMIYKIMPRVRVRWRDVWVGAGVTAMLFTIGKTLISLYIGTSGIASGYGAAGSLVVLLVWIYYSAQVFLLGVEFTWLYAHTYGSLRYKSPAS